MPSVWTRTPYGGMSWPVLGVSSVREERAHGTRLPEQASSASGRDQRKATFVNLSEAGCLRPRHTEAQIATDHRDVHPFPRRARADSPDGSGHWIGHHDASSVGCEGAGAETQAMHISNLWVRRCPDRSSLPGLGLLIPVSGPGSTMDACCRRG